MSQAVRAASGARDPLSGWVGRSAGETALLGLVSLVDAGPEW